MDNQKILTTEQLMELPPDKPKEYTEDAPRARRGESLTWEMDGSLASQQAYSITLDALGVNPTDIPVEDVAILQDIAKYAVQNARSTNPQKLFSYVKKVLRHLPNRDIRMIRRELMLSGGDY